MNSGILVATQSGEVNLNVDQKTLDMCIKATSGWRETKYTNICNGESYTVPTGSLDITVAVVLLAIGVSVAVTIAALLLKAVFDW